MLDVPADIIVISPSASIVATPAVLLVQLPPVVPSLSLFVEPKQILVDPIIADGNGSTVILVTAMHPVASVYVIFAFPDTRPETMPLAVPTVATNVLPLVQVPPLVISESVVVVPKHILAVPLITAGNELTVIVLVALQPVGKAYVILAVPAIMPVTIPVVLTVATVTSLLLHAPPGVASVKLVV